VGQGTQYMSVYVIEEIPSSVGVIFGMGFVDLAAMRCLLLEPFSFFYFILFYFILFD
jgi:hypothetical protein